MHSQEVFRYYDIRGLVSEQINEHFAYQLGLAVSSLLRSGAWVCVGGDSRTSTPQLSQALIRGLCEGGCQVLDIGMVPTPLLYFAALRFAGGSGVMVTGSHNPPEYNGFKPILGGINPSPQLLQVLGEHWGHSRPAQCQGRVAEKDVVADYQRLLQGSLVPASRSLRLVVDAGNGAAGPLAVQVLRSLGHQVDTLFCDPDGRFPNHHPDPADAKNMHALQQRVRELGADIGVAFDGDGDRLGVVDDCGNIVDSDRVLALLVENVLKNNPGGRCIYDVKCGRMLGQEIERLGGVGEIYRTGHAPIKSRMRTTGALFGGEYSGHICIADRWYGSDDALYAAARLMEGAQGEVALSERLAHLPVLVATPELQISVTEAEKNQLLSTLQEHPQWFAGDPKILTIDGVRADYPCGWGLIRVSNTTPRLTLRFEADTRDDLRGIYNNFAGALKQLREHTGSPLQMPELVYQGEH